MFGRGSEAGLGLQAFGWLTSAWLLSKRLLAKEVSLLGLSGSLTLSEENVISCDQSEECGDSY